MGLAYEDRDHVLKFLLQSNIEKINILKYQEKFYNLATLCHCVNIKRL